MRKLKTMLIVALTLLVPCMLIAILRSVQLICSDREESLLCLLCHKNAENILLS